MATPTNKKDLSIVIVNYKSWKYLRNCLESLDFTTDQLDFEIIVVDNQSADGNIETFQQEFNHVTFVENSGNNGFANGCNLGSSKANGTHVLFLNPDTIANKDALVEMWQFAKQHHTVGIVSCLQKKPKGGYEKSIRVFPNFFTLFGLTRAIYRSFNSKKLPSEENAIYTDWVSGSVVMISKEWLEQINGWNEDYWMYYEDTDLSKRVQISNGKVALLTSCEITHNHGGSSRINMKTASLTKTEVLISKHVYISIHFKGIEKLLSLFLLILFTLVSKIILGFFGILLFFIPKMRLNVYLLSKTIRYYLRSIMKGTWLSPNSMNLKTS
jgi:GT2 family glycosyltransferase